jgi:tripartite-type tricarboxylate transporter receptor subunit TctC
MNQIHRLVGCALFMLSSVFAAPVWAWPDRPIEIVVGFAPGGGTDITARTLAVYLEKELGSSVVVVNKPGASGAIALAGVARAKPDGYTLAMTNMPGLLTIPIERDAGFVPSDFTYLANLVSDPSAFSVSMESPYKNLSQLLAAIAANPGKISVSSSGVGTDDHLLMVFFEKETGTKLNHVPFNGAAPQRNAVIGGHTEIGAMNVGEAMPFNGTKVRILAQAGETRSALAPDVPTFKEQGVNIVMSSERGLVGPKGLPAEVQAKLDLALASIARNPEFRKKIESQFTELDYLPGKLWQERLKKADVELRALWARNRWAN